MILNSNELITAKEATERAKIGKIKTEEDLIKSLLPIMDKIKEFADIGDNKVTIFGVLSERQKNKLHDLGYTVQQVASGINESDTIIYW